MEKSECNTANQPIAAVVPKGYCCDRCGCTGEKLWREYNTPAGEKELLCRKCAEKFQAFLFIKGWKSDFSRGKGNMIGNFVPAIPKKGEEGFWRYNRALPSEAQDWWNNLPPQRPQPQSFN